MRSPETHSIRSGITWRAAVVALIVAGLVAFGLYAAVTGATGKSEKSSGGGDYVSLLEPVGTTGISRVTLSEGANQRLGIETVQVRPRAGGLRAIPYAAVVYDPEGNAWTYTNPKPLTYVRQRLDVDHVVGSTAFLRSGPPVGTKVVSVGAIELFGAEIDFGKG